MSHCNRRGEQQLFDKRQSIFTWLFNLHLLTVPAESLAQGSPGDPGIQTPPLAAGPVFVSFLGTWQWGSECGASQSVGQGEMTAACRARLG